MKILLIVFFTFLIQSEALSALEGTRDWGAFSDLNSSVNTWLKEHTDEEVKARYIKLLFFQFWLMYYGPDAYNDEEAKSVRVYFELQFSATKKKLNFMQADFTGMLGINGISDKKLASDHCASSMRSFRLKARDLTLGQLRGIISDFEKWSNNKFQQSR